MKVTSEEMQLQREQTPVNAPAASSKQQQCMKGRVVNNVLFDSLEFLWQFFSSFFYNFFFCKMLRANSKKIVWAGGTYAEAARTHNIVQANKAKAAELKVYNMATTTTHTYYYYYTYIRAHPSRAYIRPHFQAARNDIASFLARGRCVAQQQKQRRDEPVNDHSVYINPHTQ